LQHAYSSLALRCHRIHVPDLLEEKELPHEPLLPCRFHWPRSIRYIRCCLVLRHQSSPPGSPPYSRHLRWPHTLRMPNQVRFHLLDAIPVWWAVGIDLVWMGLIPLPMEQHYRAYLWGSWGSNLLWIHHCGHSAHHETLPRGGGNCSCHQPLPRCHQPVPVYSPNPQQLAEQLETAVRAAEWGEALMVYHWLIFYHGQYRWRWPSGKVMATGHKLKALDFGITVL
jgi:hypothetical protein